MKKLLFASALVFAAFGTVNAQDGGTAYEQGKSTVALGYGFGNIWKSSFKLLTGSGGGSTKSMGPFAVTYEYGVTEKISVGACVSFSSLKNSYTDNSEEKLTQFGIVARGNYHFGSSAKFDPYIGLGLGYYNFKFSAKDANGNDDASVIYSVPGAFGYSGQLGAKYYFTPNIGLFAEVGYIAGGYGQIGVNFKF